MRKKRWIAPVFGMLATAAFGQTAIAQTPPPPPAARRPVAPPPTAYAGRPTYTPVAPDAASRTGWPPLMEAWPTISPFEHAFEQTYNDHGIWFRDVRNQSRTYQVNVQFLSADFKDAAEVPIGSQASIGRQLDQFGESRQGIDGSREIYGVKDYFVLFSKGSYYELNDGTVEYPGPPVGALTGPLPRTPNFTFTSFGNATGEGIPDDFTWSYLKGGLVPVVDFARQPGEPNDNYSDSTDADMDEIGDVALYPISGQALGDNAVVRASGDSANIGQYKASPSSPGFQISFGLEEEDETGFVWQGYWINGQPNVFRRGFDDPGMPVATALVFFDAPHLGDGQEGFPGDPDSTDFASLVLDYNTLFQLELETEVGGTDLAFYHTPFLDWGWLRMRPLWGARYDYIRETFQFTGRDNGVAYAFDSDGDAFENDGFGNQQSFQPVVLSSRMQIFIDPDVVTRRIFPYETTALSKVRSHLYGPQVGFDMQAGGEHLMVTAVTKTGVLVDTERLSLDTTGFGAQEILTGVRPGSNDDKTHTRVVPFLEFNANADFNVFPLIPIVNRWHFLENARIRAGWSTLVVGNIQRPLPQIVWRAQESGGPYIEERGRDAWYMTYWNVGIHWTF